MEGRQFKSGRETFFGAIAFRLVFSFFFFCFCCCCFYLKTFLKTAIFTAMGRDETAKLLMALFVPQNEITVRTVVSKVPGASNINYNNSFTICTKIYYVYTLNTEPRICHVLSLHFFWAANSFFSMQIIW